MAIQKHKVFTPINIGRLTLKNRIIMAATVHEMCYNGHPTEALLATTEVYAKSGAAMITVGAASIDTDPVGQVFTSAPSVADDDYIYGMSRMAEVIRAHGAKSCQQIAHPGRLAALTLHKKQLGIQAWGASSKVPFYLASRPQLEKIDGEWRYAEVVEPAPIKAMSTEEIEHVVRLHVAAAIRVKKAGFDALNLHYANVTLMMDFISPYTNDRRDQYGGDWERRLRFPAETIQAVKSAVGKDYPVIVRIPVDQGLGDAGIQFEDVQRHIVPRLEEAGVDAIDLSAGVLDHTPDLIIPPMYQPRGLWLKYSEELKKTAKVPVIVAGRLCDPRMIMKAVETDRCDIAAISRPMMADPQMPRKMMEGRLDDVRMCTACCYCMSEEGWGKNCAINPDLSRELILPKIEPAKAVRKVLVIGGGPAGMEAARILSERGHEVTLCEKNEHLGGALFTASAAPLTREWRSYTKWHVRQIEKLGVRVQLGCDVTREYVQAMAPEAVVIATGGSPCRDVPGTELGHVVIEDEALLKKVELGDRIVVLGGAFWDVETAISLAAEGKEVTLVREKPGIAMMTLGLPKGMPLVREMMKQKGIETVFAARVEKIEANGVSVFDDTGKARFLEADSVVLSRGRIPNRSLVEELQECDCEIHQIGDCVKPANVAHAVYGARIVGATL